MKRIGFLTSGGDCQGLNPAMRGVTETLCTALGEKNVEFYGFEDGYKGLIYGRYRKMTRADFSGIQNMGGTILGTSREPFKYIQVINPETGLDKVKEMKKTYAKLKLDCLVVLGGNGSTKTANLLSSEGLNVVTLPKTIDNDIWGTDMTFGCHTAVEIATEAIDRTRTTAASHSRTFLVEIMGHKVGWLALQAGIAGGADAILLPEIPYSVNKVASLIKKNAKNGRKYSIIVVAEGAMTKEEAKMSKKERAAHFAETGIASDRLAKALAGKVEGEIRCVVPGHTQRGGNPCAYDRRFATELGAAAGQLILDEHYGFMVALKGDKLEPVPLSEVAGKLKYVPVDGEEVKYANALGISFAD